jgi:hypothetical protein
MWRNKKSGFALYEVLIGVAIFTAGILALGGAVENCIHATGLTAEEDRVRQILSDRMAELQASPGLPDPKKEIKVATGYGEVVVLQQSAPAGLKGENNTELIGINFVTLTAQWKRGGAAQSRRVQFYIYRNG